MRTVHTSERTNFIFRSLFIPLSLQIDTISSIFFLAIPIRDLVSLLQLPSADFSNPRYLKCSTTSSCSSFTITPASDCIFPIFRSLVYFTFNFSSLAFTMLITFTISLSASSCDSAQSSVSYACLRLEPDFNLSWFQFPQFPHVVSLTQCRPYTLKICERMQPCLTPLSILNALLWRPFQFMSFNWSM